MVLVTTMTVVVPHREVGVHEDIGNVRQAVDHHRTITMIEVTDDAPRHEAMMDHLPPAAMTMATTFADLHLQLEATEIRMPEAEILTVVLGAHLVMVAMGRAMVLMMNVDDTNGHAGDSLRVCSGGV